MIGHQMIGARPEKQWFPNAELVVMPNASHYPMKEVPIYLATTMEAFMRQHAGG